MDSFQERKFKIKLVIESSNFDFHQVNVLMVKLLK